MPISQALSIFPVAVSKSTAIKSQPFGSDSVFLVWLLFFGENNRLTIDMIPIFTPLFFFCAVSAIGTALFVRHMTIYQNAFLPIPYGLFFGEYFPVCTRSSAVSKSRPFPSSLSWWKRPNKPRLVG